MLIPVAGNEVEGAPGQVTDRIRPVKASVDRTKTDRVTFESEKERLDCRFF